MSIQRPAARTVPEDDLVHKRKPLSNGRGPRSVCGRYGYTTHLWKSVTCDVCREKRPAR